MKARFYVGLVSISFVATAWGMNLSMKEQIRLATAPIDMHTHYGPHYEPMIARGIIVSRSYSEGCSLPHQPRKTPSPRSQEEPTKSIGKKRDSASPRTPRLRSAPTIRESKILQALAAAEEAKKQAALAQESIEQCSKLVEQALNTDQSEQKS